MSMPAVTLAVLLALAVQGANASGRTILQAFAPVPAPAPANAIRGPVDGVFLLPAAQASFVNSTNVVLTGIPNTTAWVQITPAPKAGSVEQDFLVSQRSAASNGAFLGSPQASLSGSYNGNQSNVLLQLDAPRMDMSTHALYFNYKVLAANESSLPALGGTVNALVAQHNAPEGGGGNPVVLPYVTPGATTFLNATLTIDVVAIEQYVQQQASEKYGLIEVPLGGCCYWGYYG